LTPAEKDVLRRFCTGLRRLPELPIQVAVFGSRATGTSRVSSDLDVAVLMDCKRSPQVERTLASLAFRAQAPYQDGGVGISLRPVPIFVEDRSRGFFDGIQHSMDPIWTRPR
jgi:hypothetical protein